MSLLVYVTTPTEENARLLARGLVESQLAAGVNIGGPVHSIYRWRGNINEAREWQLFIQTAVGSFAALKEFITANHPHHTPCVIAFRIEAGHPDFLEWIGNGGTQPCILP